jgi:hypothetical protein
MDGQEQGMRGFIKKVQPKKKVNAKKKHPLTGQAGKAADAILKRHERLSKI